MMTYRAFIAEASARQAVRELRALEAQLERRLTLREIGSRRLLPSFVWRLIGGKVRQDGRAY